MVLKTRPNQLVRPPAGHGFGFQIALCGPRISAHAFSTRWRARFLFEKLIFIDYLKMTWSRHLFLFYFKRVNKIRKKTLNTTPYFGKGDLRKTGSGSGVRLLIGKVR